MFSFVVLGTATCTTTEVGVLLSLTRKQRVREIRQLTILALDPKACLLHRTEDQIPLAHIMSVFYHVRRVFYHARKVCYHA